MRLCTLQDPAGPIPEKPSLALFHATLKVPEFSFFYLFELRDPENSMILLESR